MNSNTHSITLPGWLNGLAAAVDDLDNQPLDRLPDPARAQGVLALRQLIDRLEGRWLGQLAIVDGRGAAGAEDGVQAASTASWLRTRLHMGAGAAQRAVRTARAVFRGPLTATAETLTAGAISPAHAQVLADGIHDLHHQTITDAEPVLLEVARQQDPRGLRRAISHLRLVADPDREADRTQQRFDRRGLWLSPTFEGMVALEGQLDPEAGQTLLAALEPLARPANAEDTRSGSQRTADALVELARRNLEGGQLPQTGGVRPQLLVTVDLDTLLGRPGAIGGDGGWTGPLAPEACRRLACDAAVTRVLVSRPGQPQGRGEGLTAQLRHARTLLPPTLGGAPSQPLDVGRATRVIQPAPTRRSGRPGRWLCLPGLPATPVMVRRPPPGPLAAWRPHRPRQPGLVVPGPPPGGPRRRLAAGPRPRRPAHRRTTSPIPTTSRRLASRGERNSRSFSAARSIHAAGSSSGVLLGPSCLVVTRRPALTRRSRRRFVSARFVYGA